MKLLPALLASLLATLSCIGVDDGAAKASSRHGHDISTPEDRPIIYLGFEGSAQPWIDHKTYKPLGEYLAAHTPYRFQITLGRDAEEVVGFLEERNVDVALLGVVSYLEAHKQFGAVPLVMPINKEGQPIARSSFITSEDGPIKNLSELAGVSVAMAPFHSTLGNLVPRFELMKAGIPTEKLTRLENLSKEEDVVHSVIDGRFEAGAVAEALARQSLSRGLRILHLSDPIPAGPMAVRPDMPLSVSELIKSALLSLTFDDGSTRAEWNEAIRYGFTRALDEDYEPIRQMLNRHPTGCGLECHSDARFQ